MQSTPITIRRPDSIDNGASETLGFKAIFAVVPYLFFTVANVYDMGGTHGLKYISYVLLLFLIPFARKQLRLRVYEEFGFIVMFIVWPVCSLFIGLANGADFGGDNGAISQATPFFGFFVPLLIIPILGAQKVLVWLYYVLVTMAIAIAIVTPLEFMGLAMGFITQIPDYCSALYSPYDGGIGQHRLYFQATLWLAPTAVYFARMSQFRLAMLCLAGLIMASSRSGAVIVLIFILAILIKTPRYRKSGLIGLAIAVGVGIYLLPAFVQSTINAFFTSDSPGMVKRYGHAVSVIQLFIQQPWTIFTGNGAGATFYSSGSSAWEVRMETDHLDAVFHYGIVWFGAFTILCIWTVRRLLQSVQINHKAHGLALFSMYFASGTNPHLISPLFMFYLATCYLMARPIRVSQPAKRAARRAIFTQQPLPSGGTARRNLPTPQLGVGV
jgi:hypothetical protein